MIEKGLRPDVVVVDLPRKGCDEKLLEAITHADPNRIIYVSCNPAILVRDLAYLINDGYEVCEVKPVDMFPQTMHVKCAVLMSRV